MNLPDILVFFNNVKKSGNGRYMASCPMPDHSDSDPSVSITQDVNTGKILMYCWGCDTKGFDIAKALGLRTADLNGDPGHASAVQITPQTAELLPEDVSALQDYVAVAHRNLELASEYINTRFGLTVETAFPLWLGVDTGESGITRPQSCAAFNSGTPHLIIPFLNPDGEPVGMQGRRLIEGEPRWRSVSGSGWSKMGCFGWDLDGPVIITEGPSDALAVVGRAGLPALAIRGASLTNDTVCETIKEWLAGRPAIVIGDNGEAGEKFTREIAAGVGIPSWTVPSEYSDLCDYLSDGGDLEDAVNITLSTTSTEPVQIINLNESERDQDIRIREVLLQDLDDVIYNEEIKRELRYLPEHRFESIFNIIRARAPYGQRGLVERQLSTIRMAVRGGRDPNGRGPGGGGEDGDGGIPDDGLPEIVWNAEDQTTRTESEIRNAMDQYEGKNYYQAAAGQYVTVSGDDLVNMKDSGVKSMLSSMGHWRVVNGQREMGHVPQEAAKIVTDPSWKCDLPLIKRKVEVPFMLEDGSIVSTPGFHEESGIFLLPKANDRIVVPGVPAIVTDEHVAQARKIFDDVVEGFVFKDESSRTNLIAMTLTSPLRELFRSNPMVPLLTSTAPQSGSGKGTSVRVPLSTAGVGPYSLSTTAYNPDENEFEKKLVGKLLKKSTYIFLDNIRAQVSSSVLEQMLTAANYDGRTLGYSEVNSLSTLVLWVCTLQSTGSFNRDLTRRCVPVELIKNYKGAWQHKNIDSYLADMRGELIWACFVVARKWLQDGASVSNTRLDGYVGWTEVIGGILQNVLGYDGFLENLDSFRNQQDAVAMTIDGILERWLTLYGDAEHPGRMAIEEYDDPALHQMLGLHNPSTRQVMNAMERQLVSQAGHVIGNSHIWTVVGTKNYGHEGPKKLFRAAPLPGNEE